MRFKATIAIWVDLDPGRYPSGIKTAEGIIEFEKENGVSEILFRSLSDEDTDVVLELEVL